MGRPFVYGMSVDGDNFTGRIRETARLKKDLENGMNVILMSPRRMGKTSTVNKVRSEISDPKIKVMVMDIYDCRGACRLPVPKVVHAWVHVGARPSGSRKQSLRPNGHCKNVAIHSNTILYI